MSILFFLVLKSCYNFNFFIVFQRDSLSRKKYNIHVSGNNVATPLQNFDELSSRYSLFINDSCLGTPGM